MFNIYKKKTHPYNGLFLEMAGCDGAGKSTNAAVLAKHFETMGAEVILTREPGGTLLAEDIRNVVLRYDSGIEKMQGLTELLLFGAARAQHLAEKIIPALEAGKVVICDRFAMSTRAYQGYGRGLLSKVLEMEKIIHPKLYPDYLMFFNLPFEVSIERTLARNTKSGYQGDKFDDAEVELKKRIYQGFFNERAGAEIHDPLGVIQINAMQSLETIDAELKQHAQRLIRFHSLVAS